MACPEVFAPFVRYGESFLNELRLIPTAPPIVTMWVDRGVFPGGRGAVQTTFQITRSAPLTDTPEFSIITPTATNICATDWQDVDVGFNALNFRPEKYGWQGPTICADDLYLDFEREAFLNAYFRAMKKHVDLTIENRTTAIYDHYVPKAVAEPVIEFTAPATGYPGQAPDLSALPRTSCQLNQQMLDTVAVELNEIGANMGAFSDNWIQNGPNGPEYVLMIGQELSRNLLVQSGEQRVDFRFAEMGLGPQESEILRRVGASRLIGNFRHLVTLTPPRYNWVDGTGYVRVPTYTAGVATSGFSAVINPEWKSADYEGVRVLSRSVIRDLVIPPIMSSGAMTKFGPRNYLGDWMFVTGGYKFAESCSDPLEKLGKHFAEFQHGAEPLRPETGRLIIARRCVNTAECVQCTSGAT